jgi:hypothetical protein
VRNVLIARAAGVVRKAYKRAFQVHGPTGPPGASSPGSPTSAGKRLWRSRSGCDAGKTTLLSNVERWPASNWAALVVSFRMGIIHLRHNPERLSPEQPKLRGNPDG